MDKGNASQDSQNQASDAAKLLLDLGTRGAEQREGWQLSRETGREPTRPAIDTPKAEKRRRMEGHTFPLDIEREKKEVVKPTLEEYDVDTQSEEDMEVGQPTEQGGRGNLEPKGGKKEIPQEPRGPLEWPTAPLKETTVYNFWGPVTVDAGFCYFSEVESKKKKLRIRAGSKLKLKGESGYWVVALVGQAPNRQVVVYVLCPTTQKIIGKKFSDAEAVVGTATPEELSLTEKALDEWKQKFTGQHRVHRKRSSAMTQLEDYASTSPLPSFTIQKLPESSAPVVRSPVLPPDKEDKLEKVQEETAQYQLRSSAIEQYLGDRKERLQQLDTTLKELQTQQEQSQGELKARKEPIEQSVRDYIHLLGVEENAWYGLQRLHIQKMQQSDEWFQRQDNIEQKLKKPVLPPPTAE